MAKKKDIPEVKKKKKKKEEHDGRPCRSTRN